MSEPDKQSASLPKSLADLKVGEVYEGCVLNAISDGVGGYIKNWDYWYAKDNTAVVFMKFISSLSRKNKIAGFEVTAIYDRWKEG